MRVAGYATDEKAREISKKFKCLLNEIFCDTFDLTTRYHWRLQDLLSGGIGVATFKVWGKHRICHGVFLLSPVLLSHPKF